MKIIYTLLSNKKSLFTIIEAALTTILKYFPCVSFLLSQVMSFFTVYDNWGLIIKMNSNLTIGLTKPSMT